MTVACKDENIHPPWPCGRVSCSTGSEEEGISDILSLQLDTPGDND